MSTSPLRAALDAVIAEQGCSLKDLTVLAPKNDPFRLDTPARHRDGQWLAEHRRGARPRRPHDPPARPALRAARPAETGRHAVREHDENWEWLSGRRGQGRPVPRLHAVRPDHRPAQRRARDPGPRQRPGPQAYLTTELDVNIPEAWELEPQVDVDGFDGVQPYRLALVGEKSSLADPSSAPIADRLRRRPVPADRRDQRHADLPDGQGRRRTTAGRWPCCYFADCDPAGWQMGISVSRKLQALKMLLPKMPDFEVHRVALTPGPGPASTACRPPR